jgi:hypothetical protein
VTANLKTTHRAAIGERTEFSTTRIRGSTTPHIRDPSTPHQR